MRRQTRAGVNKKDGKVRAIYGPNTEAVAALIDRWADLSLAQLIRVGLLAEVVDTQCETELWDEVEDVELVAPFVLASAGIDDVDDSASGDADGSGDIVDDAWTIILDAARAAAEARLRDVGGQCTIKSMGEALLDAFSSGMQELLHRSDMPDWTRDVMGGRMPALDIARLAVIGVARDAALALMSWDLASPDGSYTPEMREMLYAPWRDAIKRLDAREDNA